jgi:hypothetical protein
MASYLAQRCLVRITFHSRNESATPSFTICNRNSICHWRIKQNLRKVIVKAMCVLYQFCAAAGQGRKRVSLQHYLSHPLSSCCLPACRPASVLCSSDFVRVELRDTITVIGLRKRVVFCGRVSTFILVPPTGTARHLQTCISIFTE